MNNMNTNVFDYNVQQALRYADQVIDATNVSLSNAAILNQHSVSLSSNVPTSQIPTSQKNVETVICELEAKAHAQLPAALKQPSMEKTGEELIGIMNRGFDEFRRQTGRDMTYSEIRDVYG